MKASNIENDTQCLYSCGLINAVTTSRHSPQRSRGLWRELQVISSKETVRLLLGVPTEQKPETPFAALQEINPKKSKQFGKLGCSVYQRSKQMTAENVLCISNF